MVATAMALGKALGKMPMSHITVPRFDTWFQFLTLASC